MKGESRERGQASRKGFRATLLGNRRSQTAPLIRDSCVINMIVRGLVIYYKATRLEDTRPGGQRTTKVVSI